MKRFTCLLLGLLVAACSAAPEPAADYSNMVITLERTACFGTCPIYRLTIQGNGQVVYEGEDKRRHLRRSKLPSWQR
jgi:hypothetical protein